MSRTIQAPCGFEIKGEVKRVNFQFKLHQKKCEDCSSIKLTEQFNAGNNYKGHVVRSKNGNPVYRPSTITFATDSNVIGMTVKEYESKYSPLDLKQLEK
jgi:hypothetical protein